MGDGNKICVRWSFSGKHTGGGLGFAATGMVVHTTGITFVRVADGMLIEGWQNWDMLGMMEQIQGSHKAATYVGAPPIFQPSTLFDDTFGRMNPEHTDKLLATARPSTTDASSNDPQAVLHAAYAAIIRATSTRSANP
jgi:hypothetical protein